MLWGINGSSEILDQVCICFLWISSLKPTDGMYVLAPLDNRVHQS